MAVATLGGGEPAQLLGAGQPVVEGSWALRAGRDGMRWNDLSQAKLSEEIGRKQPVAHPPLEKEMVAAHEAGHAVAAYLSRGRPPARGALDRQAQGRPGPAGPQRQRGALDRTRTELLAFLRIACAAMAAEELWFGESTTGPGGDLLARRSAPPAALADPGRDG